MPKPARALGVLLELNVDAAVVSVEAEREGVEEEVGLDGTGVAPLHVGADPGTSAFLCAALAALRGVLRVSVSGFSSGA